MKEGGQVKLIPPGKTTFKKPSPIRVKECLKEVEDFVHLLRNLSFKIQSDKSLLMPS